MKERTILDSLKGKGRRMTKARKAIVQVLLKSKKPMGALDLHAALLKKGLETNHVTVYREMAFLEKAGIVQGSKFQDGTKRFCLASSGHHHHLICTKCSDVADVDMPCTDLHAMERQLAKKTDFTVKSHSLEFYGLCSRCA